MSDYLKQIWLGTCLAHGSRSLPVLLAELGDASGIYAVSETVLSPILGKRRSELRALTNKDLSRAERLLELCASREIRILTYFDKHYPASLRRLPDPPALLYLRGSLPELDSLPTVSVVGMRDPIPYSCEHTYRISYDLAAAGATIVSGMALGIDGIAAAGALAARGKTVAVFGCGVDVAYPRQHEYLSRIIAETGCVLSEYPPGASPEKWNFPLRNRIIAALGDAVLVTAGSAHSGALITARRAKELDTPIFALPGQIDTPDGEGPAILLREGAHLAASADDILVLLEQRYPALIDSAKLADSPSVPLDSALGRYRIGCQSSLRRTRGRRTADERKEKVRISSTPDAPRELPQLSHAEDVIYGRIPETGSCHPDELTDTEHPIAEVCAVLTMLEIYGLIETAPGGRIRRKL